jgi:hypothetical protein
MKYILKLTLLFSILLFSCQGSTDPVDPVAPIAVDSIAPGVVSAFTVTGGVKSAILNWTNPVDNDLDSVFVYYKKSVETNFTKMSSPKISGDITLIDLENYNGYDFKVSMVDNSGNEGLHSDTVNITLENYSADVDSYWTSISSATDLDEAISNLISLIGSEFINGDSTKTSVLKNIVGWAYYQKGDGTHTDVSYTSALAYFQQSGEKDSQAGIAILGYLLDEWALSLASAKVILADATYTHGNIPSITRDNALLDGAWSAYLLDDFNSVVDILNDIDSGNSHSASDVPGLFTSLKGL